MFSKPEFRKILEARRRALTPAEVTEKGHAAQALLREHRVYQKARTVALYAGQWFEVPTDDLWAGKRVCLPRVVGGPGTPLAFFEVNDPARLVPRGKLQLREPPDGAPPVPLDQIDLWVVPGTGFTHAGDRLGRGAGYYDATLAQRRSGSSIAGLTWDCCVVDALPSEPHDVKMHLIVTETRRLLPSDLVVSRR